MYSLSSPSNKQSDKLFTFENINNSHDENINNSNNTYQPHHQHHVSKVKQETMIVHMQAIGGEVKEGSTTTTSNVSKINAESLPNSNLVHNSVVSELSSSTAMTSSSITNISKSLESDNRMASQEVCFDQCEMESSQISFAMKTKQYKVDQCEVDHHEKKTNAYSNSSNLMAKLEEEMESFGHLNDLTRLNPSDKKLQSPMSAASATKRKKGDDIEAESKEQHQQEQHLLPPVPVRKVKSSNRPRSVSVHPKSQGLSLGASTHIGGKSENQDISFCIGLKTGFDGAIAVFDGHGKHGGVVAKRVHDFFIEKVVEILSPGRDILKMISNPMLTTEASIINQLFCKYFSEIEGEICSNPRLAENSGTTATVALQKNGKLHIASTGDSRAVLGSMIAGKDITARRLTVDHRFDIESELTMVTNAGGIVKAREGKQDGALRVWLSEEKSKEFGLRCPAPGLMVSRSVGDYLAKVAGCSAVPDVISFEVSPSDKFLIVASDGLWDILSDEEAVNIVSEFDHVRDTTWAKVTAENLVNIALKRAKEIRLRTDNITVAVMDLQKMFL